jgi:hypothetical protein
VFPHTLRREILILLAAKAALLAILYAAFFAPAHRAALTPEQTASHILAAEAPGGRYP